MKQKSKCERPSETRGNKQLDENQSESVRKISNVNKCPEVTEKVLHCYTSRNASHYSFKVSICITGWAFTKPGIIRPRFVPFQT